MTAEKEPCHSFKKMTFTNSDMTTTAISETKFKKLFCESSRKFNIDGQLYFLNKVGEVILYTGPIYFSTLKTLFSNIGDYAEIVDMRNLRIKDDTEEYKVKSSTELEYFLEIRKRHNLLCAKLSLLLLSHGIIDDVDNYNEGAEYVNQNYVGFERSDESIGRAVAKRDQLTVNESEYARIGKQERQFMINLDGHIFYKD